VVCSLQDARIFAIIFLWADSLGGGLDLLQTRSTSMLPQVLLLGIGCVRDASMCVSRCGLVDCTRVLLHMEFSNGRVHVLSLQRANSWFVAREACEACLASVCNEMRLLVEPVACVPVCFCLLYCVSNVYSLLEAVLCHGRRTKYCGMVGC
jgi:hypothetical protein